MNVFGIKTCDTVRKAMKDLAAAGFAPNLVDIRADGIAPADLERFFAAFGDRLVNTRSTTWRALSEAERAAPPTRLIADHPTLMKRPVIASGDVLTLGWDAKTREFWLGNPGPGA